MLLTDVLLTDEEILEYAGMTDDYLQDHRGMCQAQLKKVVEWGDEPCIEHQYYGDSGEIIVRPRRRCPQCWQDLRRRAGLE